MSTKILAVDDEKQIVRLVQLCLARQGYEVQGAYDGIEAIEQVGRERPDLIVLDVTMPRMDGFAVLESLRRDPRTHDIPVIMLTAKAQDADVFRAMQYGVDCYITKPFSPMELVAFVRRILEAHPDSSEPEPL